MTTYFHFSLTHTHTHTHTVTHTHTHTVTHTHTHANTHTHAHTHTQTCNGLKPTSIMRVCTTTHNASAIVTHLALWYKSRSSTGTALDDDSRHNKGSCRQRLTSGSSREAADMYSPWTWSAASEKHNESVVETSLSRLSRSPCWQDASSAHPLTV